MSNVRYKATSLTYSSRLINERMDKSVVSLSQLDCQTVVYKKAPMDERTRLNKKLHRINSHWEGEHLPTTISTSSPISRHRIDDTNIPFHLSSNILIMLIVMVLFVGWLGRWIEYGPSSIPFNFVFPIHFNSLINLLFVFRHDMQYIHRSCFIYPDRISSLLLLPPLHCPHFACSLKNNCLLFKDVVVISEENGAWSLIYWTIVPYFEF